MGAISILFDGAKKRLRALRAGLTGNLGRCGFCMRTSFAAATLSWALLAGAVLLAPPHEVVIAIAILVFLLTSLWIAHLAARAARITIAARSNVDQARRDALLMFVRAFTLTAAATAMPSAAWAQGQCAGKKCLYTPACLDRNGLPHCCADATPFLCTIDCTCHAENDLANCDSYIKCTG